MNIALTGASGFIGRHLKNAISKLAGVNLILIVRNKDNSVNNNQLSFQEFFDIKSNIQIDLFIHLASPNLDYAKDDSIEEGIVNLTKNIIETIPKYNCFRFIYFSSGKVYGEPSLNNIIFDELHDLNPVTDYAKSKLIAEKLIKKDSIKHGINYLIYRLPFVYGPGMKSNLNLILKFIDRSFPIFILNKESNLKKSFLSIENIRKIILHNIGNDSSINNQIINIADLEPISLTDFMQLYKAKVSSKSFFIPINSTLFKFLTKLPILGRLFIKVFGNFQLDNKKIKNILKEDIISTERGIVTDIKDNLEV